MIGIVGGMGTAAGVHFARRLVDLNCAAVDDSSHAAFILHSEPSIPDRTAAYLHGGSSPVAKISKSLNRLADSGAQFGVIVCNTAHIFFEEISASSNIPLINMVRNSAEFARTRAIHRIGLLATTATAKSGIYQQSLAAAGVDIVLPDEATQTAVNATIFDKSFGLKSNGTRIHRHALETICDAAHRLHQDGAVRHILLGCTELSMMGIEAHLPRYDIVDPVDLLAIHCLRRLGLPANETV